MTSTAIVRRKTGRTTQDEDTGREVPVWDVVVTGSPFRLGGANQGSSGTRTVSTPGGEAQLALRTGHFPADTEPFRDGDLIDVTAGENAGTVWRVIEADRADQQTAYRVPLVSVARPGEWA
jgi:hypothetical protein